MGNSPVLNVDPDGEFFGTALTAVFDALKTAFFDGGLDPTSGGARRDAWRDYDPTRRGTPTNNAWRIDLGLFQSDESRTTAGRIWQVFSRFIWEAPQTLAGNLISHGLNLTGQVNEVNYFRGASVLNTDIRGGAFTVGSYIMGPEGFGLDFRDHLFVHEFGHYLQSQRLGPMYLTTVAFPSVTDFYLIDRLFNANLHDTRWYEANASRLAADYFDREFGTGARGYFIGSANHFDRNSFVNGTPSPYFNPRLTGRFGLGIRNVEAYPVTGIFHWTDIPINLFWNGGIGLFGFLF